MDSGDYYTNYFSFERILYRIVASQPMVRHGLGSSLRITGHLVMGLSR